MRLLKNYFFTNSKSKLLALLYVISFVPSIALANTMPNVESGLLATYTDTNQNTYEYTVGTDQTVWQYSDVTSTWTSLPAINFAPGAANINNIIVDPNTGNIYVSNKNSIYKYANNAWKLYQSVPPGQLISSMIVVNNHLFVAYSNTVGVVDLSNNSFNSAAFPSDYGSGNIVQLLSPAGDARVFLCSESGYIDAVDENLKFYYFSSNLSGNLQSVSSCITGGVAGKTYVYLLGENLNNVQVTSYVDIAHNSHNITSILDYPYTYLSIFPNVLGHNPGIYWFDSKNDFWSGSPLSYDFGLVDRVPFNANGTAITNTQNHVYAEDSNGNLWQSNTDHPTHFDQLQYGASFAALSSTSGNLNQFYLGSSAGQVVEYDGTQYLSLGFPFNDNSSIQYIAADISGDIVVGNNNIMKGVSELAVKLSSTDNWNLIPQLSKYNYTSLAIKMINNTLFILGGTDSGSIQVFSYANGQFNQVVTINGDKSRVTSMILNDNNLFFGTNNGNVLSVPVNLLVHSEASIQAQNIGSPDQSTVSALNIDYSGNLYAGTLFGDVAVFQPGQSSWSMLGDNSVDDSGVLSLATDVDGYLYSITIGGYLKQYTGSFFIPLLPVNPNPNISHSFLGVTVNNTGNVYVTNGSIESNPAEVAASWVNTANTNQNLR